MLFAPGKAADKHYASFSRRMWAATIDTLLIVLITPVLDLFSVGSQPMMLDLQAVQQEMASQAGSGRALAVFWQAMVDAGVVHHWLVNTGVQTAVLIVLTAFCWHTWSATPGKMLLKMKVVDAATEAPISNRQIALRLAGYFVSTLPLLLGFFWISFDKRRQGWHDKIAGTVVIIAPRREKSSD